MDLHLTVYPCLNTSGSQYTCFFLIFLALSSRQLPSIKPSLNQHTCNSCMLAIFTWLRRVQILWEGRNPWEMDIPFFHFIFFIAPVKAFFQLKSTDIFLISTWKHMFSWKNKKNNMWTMKICFHGEIRKIICEPWKHMFSWRNKKK